jgi:magnesium transporter
MSDNHPEPLPTLAPAIFPAEPHPATVWIDLHNPNAELRDVVHRLTGLRVPELADLNEIETSSRLSMEDGAIYLSVPLAAPLRQGGARSSPLGLVLTQDRLITVRYADLYTVQAAVDRVRAAEAAGAGSAALLAQFLESVVDGLADVLERIGGELEHISHRTFHPPPTQKAHKAHVRASTEMRATLRAVGRTAEAMMRIRETLLSLGRIPAFLNAHAGSWIPAEVRADLEVMRADVTSLNDHIGHLTNLGQFLQDAILGFINIDQNNIMKVLTVVSVVGVPPTLIAGIYGMNFKNMPEYDWVWGYQYGLILIILTAVVPLWWFRRRGWL